jgi:hypothetical protein
MDVFNKFLANQNQQAIGEGFNKDAQLKGINNFLNSADFGKILNTQSIFDLPTTKYSGYGMSAPILFS